MRCKACNVVLEDHEATRKVKQTGEYLDMCDKCLGLEFIEMEKATQYKDEYDED